jgi:integrase
MRFYCRKSKADKQGLAPVELSISINGERTYLRLPRKERPEVFAKEYKSKRNNAINVYCENQRTHLNEVVEEMQFAGIELTATNLKECYKRGGIAPLYTLGQLWHDIIDNKTIEKANGDLDDDTYNRYILARDAFYEATGHDRNTPAQNVELQDLNRLQQHLRSKGRKQSTIHQYHAKCKAAFTLAFNRGKIKSNPYSQFKMDKGDKKEIIWLTTKELGTLTKKDFSADRLRKVRDLFLFQCYSGLSYGDMEELERRDYQENDKGQIYIEKHRKKTGVRFLSMVLAEGKRILEDYDYELPILTNQKYNSYLKEVQDICGLDKVLTTHVGRKTYVCYLYQKQVPIEVIATIVGHTTCYTTLRYYAKMDKETIFKELRKRHVANETKPKTKDKAVSLPEAQEEAKKRSEEKTESILNTLRTSGI